MGSSQVQGELWSARAREWAELQEGSFRPLYEAAFAAAGVGRGSTVLDVGCGAGLALQIAQARGATGSGLDAAAGLAAIARQRCPGSDIRLGDSETLPFPDASFDVTTGFNSFQYAADPVRALAEARRVTRPNGCVVIAVWGERERCQLAPYLAAVGRLLPPPPPGAPGPFALSAPGALEALAEPAGLRPEAARTVTTSMRFADEATALRGLLASGAVERAIRTSGEDMVRGGIAEAIRPGRQSDGSYVFANEWRFLVSRV
ncbi:MAG: methyltransferase domain-containing protein [Xanthobacteraceae bacterium]|nr:methyltransferase domain-containing protein [Xanthobacteraceae bacterium]